MHAKILALAYSTATIFWITGDTDILFGIGSSERLHQMILKCTVLKPPAQHQRLQVQTIVQTVCRLQERKREENKKLHTCRSAIKPERIWQERIKHSC